MTESFHLCGSVSMLGAGAISLVARGVSFTQVSPQTHKKERKWERSRFTAQVEQGKKGQFWVFGECQGPRFG